MADFMQKQQAKTVYETLCATLDNRNWRYKKHEDDLVVSFGVNGDDIPIDYVIKVDVERQLLRVISFLPFKIGEDKRVDGAVAICVINNGMVDGGFEYDLTDGSVTFKMTASFRESRIGEGLVAYMIDCTSYTVDRYNDKLLAVSKGMITVADLLKEEE